MTHRLQPVRVSHTFPLTSSEELSEKLDPILREHNDVAIIFVSGPREKKTYILLNYITQYLSWLSSDSEYSREYRQVIFAREGDDEDAGVFVWPAPFQVRIENRTGIMNQKLPFLLIHVSPEESQQTDEFAADTCVHIVRMSAFAPEDIVNAINAVNDKWTRAQHGTREAKEVAGEPRDGLMFLARDWRIDVPSFVTEEWFLSPSSGRSNYEISLYLQSFVYHMFGDICQLWEASSYDIMSRRVSKQITLETTDEVVVDNLVHVYWNKMRHMLSGAEVSVNSLNNIHNDTSKDVMGMLRAMNFPVQFKLQKKPILNKRLREEYEILYTKFKDWMQERKNILTLEAHETYVQSMRPVIEGDGVTDEELQRKHAAATRRAMSEFRSQCLGTDHELTAEIMETYRLLRKVIDDSHGHSSQMASSFEDLKSTYVRWFETDMTKYVNLLPEIDQRQAKRQQDIIYGRLLKKMESTLKEMSVKAADQRKLKKEIEKQVMELSNEIITKRDQELQLQAMKMDDIFMAYVKQMHHEMDTLPFMSPEESDGKHEKVMNDFLNQCSDDTSKQRLKERLEKEYSILWDQLQAANVKRVDRIQKFVTKIINAYEKKMREEFSATQKKGKLDQKHNETFKWAIDMYNDNKDVKMVGHHLKSFEEGLGEQLKLSLDKIREEHRKQSQDDYNEACASVYNLKEGLLSEYRSTMSEFCKNLRNGPTTLIQLDNEHQAALKNIMKKYRDDKTLKQLGKGGTQMENELKCKIDESFSEVRIAVTSKVEQQILEQRQQLVDRCYENYVSNMTTRFRLNSPASRFHYWDVHRACMDREIECLESSHVMKCPEMHLYRSQLVSRIDSKNEAFEVDFFSSHEFAGASGYQILDPMIEEAVTDANSFYVFFMQYNLIGYKKNEVEYVKLYNMHVCVREDSLAHLVILLKRVNIHSHEIARKYLMDKIMDDMALFAQSYSCRYEQSFADKAVNFAISSFKSLASASPDRTFLEYNEIGDVEKRMKQLLDCRVTQWCIKHPLAATADRIDARSKFTAAILSDMGQKGIPEGIIDSVRRQMIMVRRETCV